MSPDAVLAVRAAEPDDLDAVAEVMVASRRAAYPAMPPAVHSPVEVRRWLGERLGHEGVELWLAEEDGRVLGMLLLEAAWVHSLYVAPGHTGRGVGGLLLELAQQLRPGGLGLWAFESNVAARRFYARHGFVDVRRTDGSANEEHEPDVEMAWPDPASLAGLRRRIDTLDDRLAALLAQRCELTGRVQRLKDVPGHAGRDAARERAIAARMALHAPNLGPARIARIMDVVITASLDVAEQRRARSSKPADGPDAPGSASGDAQP